MLAFFTAENLVSPGLTESCPWSFNVAPEDCVLRRLPKEKRRTALLKPGTRWNVYTAVGGLARNLRVSKDNPPTVLRGLVVDYDMVSDVETVSKYLAQMPENLLPNFIEKSLGDKVRLVWVFERELLLPSPAFGTELLKTFFSRIGVAHLLAGYDAASEKLSEMWTNGGVWYEVKAAPLSHTYCLGVLCDVSKKSGLFGSAEIPIETLAEEVARRFPGRWQGEFKLDAVGVRFWDEKADCPTGCQVKPDGMLCFTGTQPFVRWTEIFGTAWVDEKRLLNLGKAAENIWFDGQNYWECLAGRWVSLMRADVVLRLKNRGLSDKARRGQGVSDVDRVLNHLQISNRVEGAAPLINYAPGVVEVNCRRMLNIANLSVVRPAEGPCGPEAFPFLWQFLQGHFARPELLPLDHFLAWLRRSYESMLFYRRLMGQAVFLCGPKNNGKTLLCMRVVAPLLGNRWADPMDYLTGETAFSDNLFESSLLAVNDEDAPKSETARQRMLTRLKALVVNPSHTYHPKFRARLSVEWTGRIFVTANDDPGSVGILPEVSVNTADKLMFFASQAFSGVWPARHELEATLERELPFFACWLLNSYAPPAEVLSNDRCGVKSYFDPVILDLSSHQANAFNLAELLETWMRSAVIWGEAGERKEWIGSPTALLSELSTCETTAAIARNYTQAQVARALTSLARQKSPLVSFSSATGREFRIAPPKN